MELAAEQECAEHWDQGNGDDRGANHRERLGECQRMKQFSFLPRQRKDGYERKHNDQHGKEDRPRNQPCRIQNSFPNQWSVFRIYFAFFQETESVLRHDNSRVNEDADSDRNS